MLHELCRNLSQRLALIFVHGAFGTVKLSLGLRRLHRDSRCLFFFIAVGPRERRKGSTYRCAVPLRNPRGLEPEPDVVCRILEEIFTPCSVPRCAGCPTYCFELSRGRVTGFRSRIATNVNIIPIYFVFARTRRTVADTAIFLITY